jgi:hypothetical protein
MLYRITVVESNPAPRCEYRDPVMGPCISDAAGGPYCGRHQDPAKRYRLISLAELRRIESRPTDEAALLRAAQRECLEADPIASVGWQMLNSISRYLAIGPGLYLAARRRGLYPSIVAMWWPPEKQ